MDKKRTIEYLESARHTIREPKFWTQKSYCRRTVDGGFSFCADGALMHCRNDINVERDYMRQYYHARNAIEDTLTKRGESVGIIFFNDRVSHDEVLKLFDDTIARLRKELQDDEQRIDHLDFEPGPDREPICA